MRIYRTPSSHISTALRVIIYIGYGIYISPYFILDEIRGDGANLHEEIVEYFSTSAAADLEVLI